MTVLASKMVPPQKWQPPSVQLLTETCQGMGLEAACPPTILLPVMKLGIEAQVDCLGITGGFAIAMARQDAKNRF